MKYTEVFSIITLKGDRQYSLFLRFGMKDKRLEFNGLIDFYEKKDTIKELYENLSYEEIVQYKMYVY